MSILTRINGVPVYTNINEALEWGAYNSSTGYHVHKHMSVTGYMGGKNHSVIPQKTRELPAKIKSKPGYRPKVGSNIISIADGVVTTTVVVGNEVYDKQGAPMVDVIARTEKYVDNTRERVTINQIPTQTTTPTVVNVAVPVQSQSTGGSRSGGGGGGGY